MNDQINRNKIPDIFYFYHKRMIWKFQGSQYWTPKLINSSSTYAGNSTSDYQHNMLFNEIIWIFLRQKGK